MTLKWLEETQLSDNNSETTHTGEEQTFLKAVPDKVKRYLWHRSYGECNYLQLMQEVENKAFISNPLYLDETLILHN